jgi:hypothetical protein
MNGRPLWTAREGLTLAATIVLPALVVLSTFALPGFELRELAIEGAGPRVASSWVEQQVAPWMQSHLLLLPKADIEARLRADPWVAAVAASKELPHRLRLRIVERRAAMVLLRAGPEGPADLLDASGRLIVSLATGEAVGTLPTIEARADSAAVPPLAVSLLGDAARLLPGGGRLNRIELLAGDEAFALTFEHIPVPLVVDADRARQELSQLGRTVPEVLRRYPTATQLDLRFRDEVLVQLPLRGTSP